MAAVQQAPEARKSAWGLAGAGLLGLAVTAAIAAYATVHPGSGATLFTLGFSAMLPMKAWLTTIAIAFAAVQIVTALAMWGRLPGVSNAPPWVAGLHRWSGTAAFVVVLPVAFHCVWSLGFATTDARTLIHSAVGCLFFGVFSAKMLSLRLRSVPAWTLPVLGGLLAVLITTLWFTASLWYFVTFSGTAQAPY